MRTKWTIPERDDFIKWHEKVISQYPPEVAREFREARDSWMPPIVTLTEFVDEQVKERKKAKQQKVSEPNCWRPSYLLYNG